MQVSRRGFLGLVGGTAAALALPGCGSLLGGSQTGELLKSKARVPKPFAVPLPVPRIAKPSRTTHDTAFYEVTAREATAEILPGLKTRIYGYDGIFPGPTFESRADRRTVVRLVNELPVPTVVHLHGGHTPHDSDGYPTDLILPRGQAGDGVDWARGMPGDIVRGSRRYVYPMKQRAATLWYHDHRMDFTGPEVYRGLAGFHIVRDDEDDALPLPKGDKDVPLMIVDRAFGGDGSFLYPALDPTLAKQPGVQEDYMEGVLGDVVLVNGAPWPEMEVTATRYRLRLLNASNARRYELAFDPQPDGGKAFVQVGSDGGLLRAPVRHDTIVIAPAERFDVVVDFSAFPVGSTVTMVNKLGEQDSTKRVMRFRVTRKERDESRVPAKLAEFEPLHEPDGGVTRKFNFSRGQVHGHPGWTINGKPFDPERIDAMPQLGAVERWRFTTDVHHPIHVHLDPFQVIDGGQYNHGWKDTVDVQPSDSVDVLVRFADYPGKYVFHCHNLEHEDMAMMANFRTMPSNARTSGSR